MYRYIILGKFTNEGFRKLDKFPSRDRAARNLVEKAGGELHIFYTMGEYDFVAVVEMPDEDSMLKLILRMGKVGDVKTRTMRAWSETEFHELLNHFEG